MFYDAWPVAGGAFPPYIGLPYNLLVQIFCVFTIQYFK